MLNKLFIAVFIFFSLAIIAESAVQFEMVHKEFDPEINAKTNILVDGESLKMEYNEDGKVLGTTMIFIGDKNKMIFVDHAEKKYFIMDKEDIKKISDQLKQAMTQLDEALKDMPPAQREQMKKLMKGKMPNMSDSDYIQPVMKKAGSDKINGYTCVNYDIYKGDKLYRKSCVSKWGSIEGGEQIAAAMINMADFMEDMTKALSNNSQVKFEKNVFNQLRELNGFPVKTIDYGDSNEIISESIFESSKIVNAEKSAFEPPNGYKREVISM